MYALLKEKGRKKKKKERKNRDKRKNEWVAVAAQPAVCTEYRVRLNGCLYGTYLTAVHCVHGMV